MLYILFFSSKPSPLDHNFESNFHLLGHKIGTSEATSDGADKGKLAAYVVGEVIKAMLIK